MWAGEDAYIQAVLRWWGWAPWPDERRYPECGMDDLLEIRVEEVLLPSELFPFKEAHRAECQPDVDAWWTEKCSVGMAAGCVRCPT